MKETKVKNKILSSIAILCSTIILIYGFGVGLVGSNNPEFMSQVNWAVAGPVVFFIVVALITTIIKIAKVTVPAYRETHEIKLMKAAKAMDIIVLIGFVFIILALIGACIPTGDWGSRTATLVSLILIGVPFVFVGNILSYKLTNSALK